MDKETKDEFRRIDTRLRRLEWLVAGLIATQAAMIGVGSFLAVAYFEHLIGG